MFDIGWTELLGLGSIALIVVGPKDLPHMLKTLGQTAGQAKRMARDFQRSMEDAASEADIGKEMRDVQKSMSEFSSKMGSDAPRKYAERFMNDDAPAKAKSAAASASAVAAPGSAADPAPAVPAETAAPAEPRPSSPPASGA